MTEVKPVLNKLYIKFHEKWISSYACRDCFTGVLNAYAAVGANPPRQFRIARVTHVLYPVRIFCFATNLRYFCQRVLHNNWLIHSCKKAGTYLPQPTAWW